MSSAADDQTLSDEEVIQIEGMHKWYGQFHALKDINLKVKRGERIVICGPSGSGKSTMIRCINRLEEHQQGRIAVDGIELTHDLKNIDAIRREVGMVFQHFNLFPHLTVLENCTLGQVWVRQLPKKEAEETAMHYLERVKIPEQAGKYPGQLSGGQQQRVAIARALMADPKILILDDAFAAVDTKTEQEILTGLRPLLRQRTSIVVSHRISTIREAHLILVLDGGQVIERGDHRTLVAKDGVYAELHRKQLLEAELDAS